MAHTPRGMLMASLRLRLFTASLTLIASAWSHPASAADTTPPAKPAAAKPTPAAKPTAPAARAPATPAARTAQPAPKRTVDAAAAARARQLEINKRNDAQAAALRTRQAEINRQNEAKAAALRARQAEINKKKEAEAAARAVAARGGQPAEKPRQIISKDSALGQAGTAAQGPGTAAKVFDGTR